MKKFIGIIVGLVVVVAIIAGFLCYKGNVSKTPEAQPENIVFVQYYDNYISQVTKNDDENIYNNLLDEKLRKNYTFEQISQMNDYLRSKGDVKKFDKNSVKVETKKVNNITVYVISSIIDFTKDSQLVKIELVKNKDDYKITSFSFTNEY